MVLVMHKRPRWKRELSSDCMWGSCGPAQPPPFADFVALYHHPPHTDTKVCLWLVMLAYPQVCHINNVERVSIIAGGEFTTSLPSRVDSDLRNPGNAVFACLLFFCWKWNVIDQPAPSNQMTVQQAVCRLRDTRSEATVASQPKNKMDCQPRSPRGKRETAATFGRVMSSVAPLPGENTEGIACFYSIFLSLSLSGEKVCLPSPSLPASIIWISPSSPLPLWQQRCVRGWKGNFHHSAHEYWTASSSFD